MLSSTWAQATEPSRPPVDCAGLLPEGSRLKPGDAKAAADRVGASMLFTLPQWIVTEASVRDETSGRNRLLLTLREGTSAPEVFAEIQRMGDNGTEVRWDIPPLRSDPEAAARRLTVVEHLYAFVYRQPPLQVFAFRHGGTNEAATQRWGQPELLARLAQMRRCAVADYTRAGGRAQPLDWEVPVLSRPTASGKMKTRLASRVRYANAGAYSGTITFARGAHLVCSAPVDKSGSAACTLFDSHGHADHGDDVSAPTIVTFGGVVEGKRLVLPMTRVDGGSLKAARH